MTTTEKIGREAQRSETNNQTASDDSDLDFSALLGLAPSETDSRPFQIEMDIEADRQQLPAMLQQMELRLANQLDMLAGSFNQKIRFDSTKEKTIDRLHEELQDYRGDNFTRMLLPILKDLVSLHDDIEGFLEQSRAAENTEDPACEVVLSSLKQAVLDILDRNDVGGFSEITDDFNPKRQRAVQTVATPSKQLHRQVKCRLREGFSYGERVLRPEAVAVYIHRAPEQAEADDAAVTPEATSGAGE